MSIVVRAEQVSLIMLTLGDIWLRSESFWRSIRFAMVWLQSIWSFLMVVIIKVFSMRRNVYSGETMTESLLSR